MTYTRPNGSGLCVVSHDPAHRAEDSLHLCRGCIATATRDLSAIPRLTADLELALIPSKGASGPKVTGTQERGLPWNERAGQARSDLLEWLRSWSMVVSEDRGHALPQDTTVRGLSRWLTDQVDWFAGQPFADEWASNLRANIAAGRGVLAGQRRQVLDVGPCPDEDRCDVQTREGVTCTGRLRSTIELDREHPDPTTVTCDACGKHTLTAGLPELGRRITGRVWLTTAEAAQVLGLQESTVRNLGAKQGWRRRDPAGMRPVHWDGVDVARHAERGACA